MKVVVSNQRRAMSSPIDAAKRALEKKPGGSDPESPHKKRAGDEDKDMKQMMKQMMGMMGNMETKIDGVTTKVDDAVQIAKEAKDSVKLVEVKIMAVQGEVDSMTQELKDSQKKMDTWKASIEVNIAKTSAQ